MKAAWKRVDLKPYDRVLSSSHAFGHHLAGRAALEGKQAFCYVHSPARYIWAPEYDHRGRGVAAKLAAGLLQRTDRSGTNSAVAYAANSEFVRDRIRRSWDQDARVIYPPVDVDRIRSTRSWRSQLRASEEAVATSLPANFILGASRFVEYKRLDLVIRIGAKLGLPVVLAGTGPDETRLRELGANSSAPVHFVGRVSDEMLYWLYSAASLFVFLAIEDFGIMPIESVAAGTPILVNSVGGAAESVRITGGGTSATTDSISDLVDSARLAMSVNMVAAQDRVSVFGYSTFRTNIHAWAGPNYADEVAR